jgi:uncharacterized protein YegP (UPF0339 family)
MGGGGVGDLAPFITLKGVVVMALKIVKYKDKKGGHRWSIRSRNGKVIADGAESYTSAAMRDKGLLALTSAITDGHFKVVDETPAPKPVAAKKAVKTVVKTKAKKLVVAPKLSAGSATVQ